MMDSKTYINGYYVTAYDINGDVIPCVWNVYYKTASVANNKAKEILSYSNVYRVDIIRVNRNNKNYLSTFAVFGKKNGIAFCIDKNGKARNIRL